MPENLFKFKRFAVKQNHNVFRITTDATLLAGLFQSSRFTELDSCNILEVGCGTGVISLMLAQKFPNAHICAIDNNPDAVALAIENVQNSVFNDRIDIIEADVFDFEPIQKFDMILCNPPYFLDDTPSKEESKAHARHQNGFDYFDLVEKFVSLIASQGEISMILPFRYQEMVNEAFAKYHMVEKKEILIRHHKKAPVRNMIITCNIIIPMAPIQNTMSTKMYFEIKNEDNQYSKNFILAMKDYLSIL